MDEIHVHQTKKVVNASGVSNPIYGFGFLGALIYFISHATGFWNGVLGILKAIIWPAIVSYKLLEFLKL